MLQNFFKSMDEVWSTFFLEKNEKSFGPNPPEQKKSLGMLDNLHGLLLSHGVNILYSLEHGVQVPGRTFR